MSKKRQHSQQENYSDKASQNSQRKGQHAGESSMGVKLSHIENSTINISGRDVLNINESIPSDKPVYEQQSKTSLTNKRSSEAVLLESPLRVFLCHSSDDKPVARKLYHQLIAEKFIDPWLDEEKLLPGENWDFEIKKAVRASDVIIVLLSLGSVSKEGYVQKEISLALNVAEEKPEGTIFIIPLKLDECIVPERLNHWQWVNYFEDNAHEKLIRALNKRAIQLGIKSSDTQSDVF